MPPKRKLPSNNNIPSNAASAIAYTDASGAAPNKRSKVSKPLPKADPTAPDDAPALPSPTFDHSRPEEKAGIIDRRFYPSEMSNERCAMYNDNSIPRPIQVLNATLASTKAARAAIRDATSTSSENPPVVVHWFKRDLRIRDNTSLSRASALAKEKGGGVIGLWILSPEDWEAHIVSPAKCDFEVRSVQLLKEELMQDFGIPLHTILVPYRKDVVGKVLGLAEEWGARNVFCNLEYEVDELRREEKLIREGLKNDVNVEVWHDDCVVPPGELKTGTGKQYAVYTPWFRSWLQYLHANPHVLDERHPPSPNPPSFTATFKHLHDTPTPSVPSSKQFTTSSEKTRIQTLYPAGETAALTRLTHFLSQKIGAYNTTRNFPSLHSTSSVSMHHAAGTLSARTSIRSARAINSTKRLDGGLEGVRVWISEVAWRDFYRHVLVHWPYICMSKPFKYEYTNISWETNPTHLTAWKQGKTGYPIVDAAMRCLNHTAYMHNRNRMIVASFLAKHLLLDWRLGERYFMSRLVDGDFASNNGGWGFAASTGVDPQPYFRVFNPWLQGEKFDGEGDFVREWVEELRDVKGKGVLNPYEAGGEAERVARRNGYPRPIVEHRVARERCLERYKSGLGRGTA
ncbi:photolyase [Periconia macrospinosa]|uniref:Photolyase n=1 Tax=Periconia macrospinosa TaxID=97972 RepID=A0A2V1DJX7_9PLEO|nr:photolyase [Periconia macrospinosa]